MKSLTEQYQCQSYSDDDRNVQDCTCGKCGNTPDTEGESVELLATNLWAIIYEGLIKDGVKFPKNFNGIGAAYGGYARIIEAFEKERTSRDTYWKERVRERILSNAYPIGMKNPIEVVDVKDIISETQ